MPAQDTAEPTARTIADVAPEAQVGMGREMGVADLEEFLERKTFAVPAVPAKGAPA